MLLQCIFMGEAQEVHSALPIDRSSVYQAFKAESLKAYELVPKDSRQRLSSAEKRDGCTFVEFAKKMVYFSAGQW